MSCDTELPLKSSMLEACINCQNLHLVIRKKGIIALHFFFLSLSLLPLSVSLSFSLLPPLFDIHNSALNVINRTLLNAWKSLKAELRQRSEAHSKFAGKVVKFFHPTVDLIVLLQCFR